MKLIIFIILIIPSVAKSQWEKIYDAPGPLSKIYFYDDNYGIACDDYKNVYVTSNGGTDWNSTQLNFLDNFIDIHDIKFYNYDIGWIVGGAGCIFKTSDGGMTWRQIDSTYSVTNFSEINAIKIIDADTVLFAGGFITPGPAVIYRTTDGGETLSKIFQVFTPTPLGLEFRDWMFRKKEGYVITNGGAVYKTEDEGLTWTLLSDSIYLKKIYIKDSLNLTGYYSKAVYYSYDAGYNWEKVFDSEWDTWTETGFWFNYFFPADSSCCWSVTWEYPQQRLYNRVTTNGGKNWEIIFPVPDTNIVFSDIYFLDKDKGWAVADNHVYKTDNGGIAGTQGVGQQIPNNISLYQNYPNPFNPSTTISFSIPRGQRVELSIYDLTGKKLITLLNEYKPAGKHSAVFNGSEFSSGVYFYQLKTDEFIQTKKFIILK